MLPSMVPSDLKELSAGDLAKGALMVVGGIAVAGFVLSMLSPLLTVAVVGGAAYLGYRLVRGAKNKALAGGSRQALPAGDSFDQKMRSLDALSAKLDAKMERDSRDS